MKMFTLKRYVYPIGIYTYVINTLQINVCLGNSNVTPKLSPCNPVKEQKILRKSRKKTISRSDAKEGVLVIQFVLP
jgi:hypothetical protein